MNLEFFEVRLQFANIRLSYADVRGLIAFTRQLSNTHCVGDVKIFK